MLAGDLRRGQRLERKRELRRDIDSSVNHRRRYRQLTKLKRQGWVFEKPASYSDWGVIDRYGTFFRQTTAWNGRGERYIYKAV